MDHMRRQALIWSRDIHSAGLTFEDMLRIADGVQPELDGCEIFSGAGNIYTAMHLRDLKAEKYDILENPLNDALTNLGATRATRMVARVRPGGMAWIACDCGSFCHLYSQSGRSKSNPAGDETRFKVEQGNSMARLSILLFLLSWVRGVFPILENPQANYFWSYEPIARTLSYMAAHVTVAICCRCRFVTAREKEKKPYKLVGTASWMGDLNFPCKCKKEHKKLHTRKVDAHGVVKTTGKAAVLKASGEYPLKMAKAMVAAWMLHYRKPQPTSASDDDWCRNLE
ncbi:unnamed protein product [Symbiodinium sp. CCMP2592]|nr:unnamed protein product [Symbiodinium sp. CCMP2592]CAE7250497.1 unnamed protein product [Symbiodinium sp. CCMP2592]CAE7250504.1 unnamed protein product [Symbiodinium sp. CCMP2592]